MEDSKGSYFLLIIYGIHHPLEHMHMIQSCNHNRFNFLRIFSNTTRFDIRAPSNIVSWRLCWCCCCSRILILVGTFSCICSLCIRCPCFYPYIICLVLREFLPFKITNMVWYPSWVSSTPVLFSTIINTFMRPSYTSRAWGRTITIINSTTIVSYKLMKYMASVTSALTSSMSFSTPIFIINFDNYSFWVQGNLERFVS